MSRNSFDEGDDKITPLARTFTATEEGNRVLEMGAHAAARRKSNVYRSNTTGGSNGPRQVNDNSFSRSNTTNNKPSRSKSVKEVLSRSRSTKEPFQEHTISNSGFAPSRSKSLRAPPPPRLQLRKNADGKLGIPDVPVPDFPSPGRAPRGQRIFDPQTIAEDEGVEVEQGGWAVDRRTQRKLDEERKKIEEQERQNVFTGVDGDIKHNKTGRQRSKSFKDIFRRS